MPHIELHDVEQQPNASPEDLSRTICARFGLLPRKKDGNAKMEQILLELYERKKLATRERRPEKGLMTVEEMGVFAGIKRQTMYDYLRRWLTLNILKKISFVNDGKVIIGYELNGVNVESAFKKAEQTIRNHIEISLHLIEDLQNNIKKEKISASSKKEEY